MTPRPPLLLFMLPAAVLAAAALPVFAGEGDTPAPTVVHAAPPRSLGVVVPSHLPVADDGEAGERRLVPNVFPDPADIPQGESLPLDWPEVEGPLTFVQEPESLSLEDATAAGYPAIDVRFDGPYYGNVAPPDPVMAAGRHDVVVLINERIAIYDKAGTLLSGPYSLKSFFGIPAGFSSFDPLALYDPWADRFIVLCTSDNGSTQDSRLFIAFSQTDRADGSWNKYWIDADAGQAGLWADYPSIGIDRLAVYVTADMFTRSKALNNITLFVYDKADGYAGDPLDNSHLVDVRTAGGGMPFRLRPAYVPETVPGDEYYLAYTNQAFGSSLSLFRLTGDRFASPTLSAAEVALPDMFLLWGSADQPGDMGVETLGASLWNVFYRSGRIWTAQALWGTQTIAAWVHRIEVGSNPAVREETYHVEATGRDSYFPHVIPDSEDNDFALLTAYSGADLYVTGRYWNVDAFGSVRTAELLTSGQRSNNSERHGDYFAVGVDPTDSNRLWMVAQYMKNSSFAGNQKIASVLFEDVTPPPPPPPVPDGHAISGDPVQVAKASGDEVTITWDAITCPATDHHLVWYDLGAMSSHTVTDETCTIGTSGSWTGPPPGGSVGVIVVSDDGETVEGSHGTYGTDLERPSTSTQCGLTSKSTEGSCTP